MDELRKQADQLRHDVADATERLQIARLSGELAKLQKQSQQSDFWKDSERAQSVMKEISKLEGRAKPWLELRKSPEDISELIKTGDQSLTDELKKQLEQISRTFESKKAELKFSGPYDD